MVHFIKMAACTWEVLFTHFTKSISISHAGQAFCKEQVVRKHFCGIEGVGALPRITRALLLEIFL